MKKKSIRIRPKTKKGYDTIKTGYGIPELGEDDLGRLMDLLQQKCGSCKERKWLYVENLEIIDKKYMRYMCMHCEESYRCIPLWLIRGEKQPC